MSLILASSVVHAQAVSLFDSAAKYAVKDPRKAALITTGALAGAAIVGQIIYELLPSVKRQRAEEQKAKTLKLISLNIKAVEDIVNASSDNWVDSILEQQDADSIIAILKATYGNDNPLGRAYNSIRLDLKGLSYAAERESLTHNDLTLFDYKYSDQEEVLNPLKKRLSVTKNSSDSKREKLERCLILLEKQEGFFVQYQACEAEYTALLTRYIEEKEQVVRDLERKVNQMRTTNMSVAAVGLLAQGALLYYATRPSGNKRDVQQEKQQKEVDNLVETFTDFWN